MTTALNWLGRLAVLTLSLLATLSIIGSIAAIPSGSVEGRLGLDDRQAYVSAPRRASGEASRFDPRQAADAPSSLPAGADRVAGGITQSAQSPRDNPLRWLEPLTYAVIALAGLMAIGVLLLWRAVVAIENRR